MEKELKWGVVELLLSEIKEYEASVREYSLEDLDNAKNSIKKIGLVEPLVVNKNNVLIDGKLRLNAMLELGIEKCLCTAPDRLLDEAEHAEAYLRKNRNIAGVDDYSILREHFSISELKEGGFSDMEIEDIQIDPTDIVVDEKPKRFPYEMTFDTSEDKEVAEELLSRVREQNNVEEAVENSLLAVIKKAGNGK